MPVSFHFDNDKPLLYYEPIFISNPALHLATEVQFTCILLSLPGHAQLLVQNQYIN